MTDEMMQLQGLLEKSADADVLREMIGFASQRLMELEVGARTGAGYGQKDPARLAQRNGYRERDWQTRAGSVELAIPKLRQGSCIFRSREASIPAHGKPAFRLMGSQHSG
jgi:transposase-like protein